MIIGLIIIIMLVLILPFLSKIVEHNLEYFLFIMGLAAVLVAGVLSTGLVREIMSNHLLYLITGAVLIAGLLFKFLRKSVDRLITKLLRRMSLQILVVIVIVLLGLASSIITAIIASLLLVEILHCMPLSRKEKVRINILACFSIGLGAVLTPIGEPLSTIVTSRLGGDFWYLFRLLGIYILPGTMVFGLLSVFVLRGRRKPQQNGMALNVDEEKSLMLEEKYKEVFLRAFKVFVFVLALELLGAGFKPVIDTYIAGLNGRFLFWGNMISSILDNATLAAAEISPIMTQMQIRAILMGLLISGGMLIPGNIPNIISASKLRIKSKEWAIFGAPLGFAVMVVYFAILFVL